MTKRIVCFGDSNTYCVHPDGSRMDEDKRWTGILAQELRSGYTIIEEGLKGRTTVFEDPLKEGMNGLAYLVPCLKSHSPLDLLTIMLGSNDVKQIYNATSRNIGDAMARLVKAAKSAGCWRKKPNILIISPVHIEKAMESTDFGEKYGVGSSEKSYLLARYYRAVAKNENCGFLDAADYAGVNHVDYIHIAEEDHPRLGRAVAEKVLEIFNESTREKV